MFLDWTSLVTRLKVFRNRFNSSRTAMKFSISGRDSETGAARNLTVDAESESEAIQLAKAANIFPSIVKPLVGSTPPQQQVSKAITERNSYWTDFANALVFVFHLGLGLYLTFCVSPWYLALIPIGGFILWLLNSRRNPSSIPRRILAQIAFVDSAIVTSVILSVVFSVYGLRGYRPAPFGISLPPLSGASSNRMTDKSVVIAANIVTMYLPMLGPDLDPTLAKMAALVLNHPDDLDDLGNVNIDPAYTHSCREFLDYCRKVIPERYPELHRELQANPATAGAF